MWERPRQRRRESREITSASALLVIQPFAIVSRDDSVCCAHAYRLVQWRTQLFCSVLGSVILLSREEEEEEEERSPLNKKRGWLPSWPQLRDPDASAVLCCWSLQQVVLEWLVRLKGRIRNRHWPTLQTRCFACCRIARNKLMTATKFFFFSF